jgi:hypothetical protein
MRDFRKLTVWGRSHQLGCGSTLPRCPSRGTSGGLAKDLKYLDSDEYEAIAAAAVEVKRMLEASYRGLRLMAES